MASRVLTSSLRASGVASRSSVVASTLPRQQSRSISSTPPANQQPPSEKASELINSMPSSRGLITKTGTVILGTGLLATAISQELYVVNEETVVAAGFFLIVAYLGKTIREPYRQWAQGHVDRIKGVMDSARETHTSTVKDRISSIESMKEAIPLTTQLFELSKETAKLESSSFELRQRVALAAELKAVLDSWVRFEQSQKKGEQDELVKSVVDKIMKSINDEKVQKDILLDAVAQLEQMVKGKTL